MALQILVASDHAIIRDAVVELLRAQPSLHPRGTRLDSQEEHVEKASLVLCILDKRPDIADVVAGLNQRHPAAPVLCLLLTQDDEAVVSALRSGVRGVIDDTFDGDQLIESIQQCAEGQFVMSKSLATRLAQQYAFGPEAAPTTAPDADLTHRENEVLGLLAEGCTNRQIATKLCVSEHTVRAHLRAIMQKLQVSNRVQAATIAWQSRLTQREVAGRGVGHAHSRR
ncbi:MAG: response regulator transcription factor [Dehalococcoidia bacterium]